MAKEYRVRLLYDYPGSLWPNGKQREAADGWITARQLRKYAVEVGQGWQLDEDDEDLPYEVLSPDPCLVQIIQVRTV